MSHLICPVDEQIVGDLDQVGEGEGQLVLSLHPNPTKVIFFVNTHVLFRLRIRTKFTFIKIRPEKKE